MKKTLLTLAALLTSMGLFAQTNLAIGGTATATYGDAALAIDGNTDTRWEATAGNFAGSEFCEFILDLGEAKEFDRIQILWEGAFSKDYVLEVSNDQTTWTKVGEKHENPVVKPTYEGHDFEPVTARYIRFTNNQRGTGYGVSFWEFEVYKKDARVLHSLTLEGPADAIPVNTPETLSVTARDQYGDIINTGDVTFAADPATNCSFNGNTFTATVGGNYNITATAQGITSNVVTIPVYSGEKIDIFSNWSTMVTPLNDETQTGSMVGAFDDNMASVWLLHDNKDERQYEVGFTIDFGKVLDITAVRIWFEGASSRAYDVYGITTDNTPTLLYSSGTNAEGILAFKDFTVLTDAKDFRGIRFVSTWAATQYGIKIYDFSVWGENERDLPDTEAPENFSASVVKTGYDRVVLNLSATDDVAAAIAYNIAYTDGEKSATATASGASGAAVNYAVEGLNPATEYTFTITAADAKGNATEPVTLSATTANFALPDAPTHAAENVYSIYSDTYGNATDFVLRPDWGQSTAMDEKIFNGEHYIDMSNFNYEGLEFQKRDVEEMAALHVDVYAFTDCVIRVVPIFRNPADNGNEKEIGKVLELSAAQWNSFDIPMTKYADAARNGQSLVYQIKFDNGTDNHFLLDNIYFWKENVVDEEAPVWVSASVTDVKDTKATVVLNATDNRTLSNLTYTLSDGANVIATKTMTQGQDAEIVLSDLTPETTYNLTASVADAAGNFTPYDGTISFTTLEEEHLGGNTRDYVYNGYANFAFHDAKINENEAWQRNSYYGGAPYSITVTPDDDIRLDVDLSGLPNIRGAVLKANLNYAGTDHFAYPVLNEQTNIWSVTMDDMKNNPQLSFGDLIDKFMIFIDYHSTSMGSTSYIVPDYHIGDVQEPVVIGEPVTFEISLPEFTGIGRDAYISVKAQDSNGNYINDDDLDISFDPSEDYTIEGFRFIPLAKSTYEDNSSNGYTVTAYCNGLTSSASIHSLFYGFSKRITLVNVHALEQDHVVAIESGINNYDDNQMIINCEQTRDHLIHFEFENPTYVECIEFVWANKRAHLYEVRLSMDVPEDCWYHSLPNTGEENPQPQAVVRMMAPRADGDPVYPEVQPRESDGIEYPSYFAQTVTDNNDTASDYVYHYVYNHMPVRAQHLVVDTKPADGSRGSEEPMQLKAVNVYGSVDNMIYTAIETILDENFSDAPVEYFSISGIPVNATNLAPGIYIRRQGNIVSKILVR